MAIRDRLIETASRRRYVTVTIPGLGDVRLQSLTESERLAIAKAVAAGGSQVVETAIRAIVDEHNNTELVEGDRSWLLNLDLAVVNPLSDALNSHVFPTSAEETIKN